MIIDPMVSMNVNGVNQLVPTKSAWTDIYNNGTAIPDITNITYNFGKKAYPQLDENNKPIKDPTNTNKFIMTPEVPVLTTIVTFADGSKEMVQNSRGDGLQLDNDNRPTVFSKEVGLAFCILKRITAGRYITNDNTLKLEYKSAGFGNVLKKLIAKSIDQDLIRKQRDAERAAKNKKKSVETQVKTPKNKTNPSLHSCVSDLSKTISELKDFIAANLQTNN